MVSLAFITISLDLICLSFISRRSHGSGSFGGGHRRQSGLSLALHITLLSRDFLFMGMLGMSEWCPVVAIEACLFGLTSCGRLLVIRGLSAAIMQGLHV